MKHKLLNFKIFIIVLFILSNLNCCIFADIITNPSKYDDVRNVLANNSSKKIFDAALEFYLATDGSNSPNYHSKFRFFEKKYTHVNKDDVVIDVGISGDISQTKIFLKQLGKKGKLYGIEGNPRIIDHINNQLKKYDNFYLYNYAAYNYDGQGEFDLGIDPDDLNSYFSRIPVDEMRTNNIINVDYIKLDTFYKKYNINKVDYLKLDVEGSELEVLEGAANLIKTFKPVMLIEFHNPTALYNVILYIASLNCNYKIHLVQFRGEDYTPIYRWRNYQIYATTK